MTRKPIVEVIRNYAYYIDCIPKKVFHTRDTCCIDCPYPRHGVICHDDTGCLRKDMEQISIRDKQRKTNYKKSRDWEEKICKL